jgi:cytochrome c-type biogenesis protein CcsB
MRLALLTFLLSLSTFASICDSFKSLDTFATLNHGRVKPYMVASSEFIKSVSGKTQIDGTTASEAFCLISTGDGAELTEKIMVHIDHIKLKKLVGITDSESEITMTKAKTFKEIARAEIMSLKENNSYKKSLNKFWYKVDQFEKASRGEFWTVPELSGDQVSWKLITSFGGELNIDLLKSRDTSFKSTIENEVSLEVKYAKSNIFTWAMLISIIGIFLTVLLKNATAGIVTAWFLIVVEAIGMYMRVMISGRAPVTNMYETVLFSGFGALFIALIIYQFKKDKLFILAGLGYNILCLFMMKFADGMLTEAISPLVPVLRDNFWLSTHVSTIILSYAALALSWMLANIVLIKGRFGNLTAKDLKYYEDLIYAAIKVGIVLLAAGIILGGVWADYSWGRFWGWDPKETWSLIVLLIYVAVLHGKSTSWINTKGFIIFSAAGFMSVMMAWFGVNYILATGLHSYGFSEGGAIFLMTFFVTQIVMILFTATGLKTKKNA